MVKTWGAAAAVVAAMTLAGCSGGSAQSVATKTVAHETTVTVTTTVTATASAAQVTAGPSKGLAVGKTINLQGNKITVLHVGDKPASNEGNLIGADQRFVGVEVKYCLAEEAQLGYDPWRVVGSDGGEYEAVDVTPAPTDWPQPTYPYDDPDGPGRAAGSCVTGWMMFGVNKSAKVAAVAYRGDPGTATWNVS